MRIRFIRRSLRMASVLLAAWITIMALPLTATGQGGRAEPLPGDRLHLPSVIVTPLGLEAEGITGYTLDYAAMYHTVDEALRDTAIASRTDMNLQNIAGVEDLLATSGWLQQHEQRFGKIHEAVPQMYSHAFAISIEQYATPEGAAAAFAVLTSEEVLATSTDAEGRQALVPSTALGQQAVLWSHAGFESSPMVSEPGITIMVQVDSFILSLNHAALSGEGDPPDQAALERVMLRQILHIAADQMAGTPPTCMPGAAGGFCAQRLVGDGASSSYGFYTVRNGSAMPTLQPDDAARQAEIDRSGLRDSYELRYRITGPEGRAFYYVTIEAYAGEAEAIAAFDGTEAQARASETMTLVSFEAAVPTTGDAAAIWTGEYQFVGYETGSVVRIGSMIVMVYITLTSEPLPELTEALMQLQLACLQTGECLAPIPVPPELVASAAMN